MRYGEPAPPGRVLMRRLCRDGDGDEENPHGAAQETSAGLPPGGSSLKRTAGVLLIVAQG